MISCRLKKAIISVLECSKRTNCCINERMKIDECQGTLINNVFYNDKTLKPTSFMLFLIIIIDMMYQSLS